MSPYIVLRIAYVVLRKSWMEVRCSLLDARLPSLILVLSLGFGFSMNNEL